MSCYCHTCGRPIGSMGIMSHRAAHRRKRQDCFITYSDGKKYWHKFSQLKPEKKDAD